MRAGRQHRPVLSGVVPLPVIASRAVNFARMTDDDKLVLALKLQAEGRLDDAVTLFEELLATAPNHPPAL